MHLGRGSVGVGPFPYDVHGRTLRCAPKGARPTWVSESVSVGETQHQALLREMPEYQDLHHRERLRSEWRETAARVSYLEEIVQAGAYELTHDELEHGVGLHGAMRPSAPQQFLNARVGRQSDIGDWNS